PHAEVAKMFATETAHGAAVVFRYQDADGRHLYNKYRAVSSKRFWRRPSGSISALYGLPRLHECDFERVIIVEGELDARALWAVGFQAVVSVPDGCGSRLTAELLAPLAPFREVLIATDADPPGDELAICLAKELNPERCRRACLESPNGGKDA